MHQLSPHARRRSAQRRVPPDHVQLALDWGRPIRQPGGRVAYHLGHREVADALHAGVTLPERALGVTVVLAGDGAVVTVVRSPDRHRLTTHGRRARQMGGAR